MKVAVISDVHGNAAALQEVLEEAKILGVVYLFVLGDLVGYYYHIAKVMDLLEKWPKDVIRGNHEVMLKSALKEPEISRSIYSQYGSGISIALETLNCSQISILTTLPFEKTVKLDNLNCLLCHGSPWDFNAYIYPDSPKELIEKCIVPGVDYIFLGHTHYQCAFYNETAVIINPGSVGQARKNGGVAEWAIFDTCSQGIEFKQTSYDTVELIREVKEIDPHFPYLWEVLERRTV